MSILRDLSFGNKNECVILEKLQKDFPDCVKTTNYHPFDYFADNTYFELKSRRINHNTYDTTMIGYNKIKYAKNHPEFNYVFLFKFNDGLYKHHYDPNKEYTISKGGRYDRGKAEISDYAFIPICDLTLI